jgi:hypothetical protein
MSLTATALYNGITIGSSATPQAPYSATQVSPGVNNSLTGNALVFNFIVTNGSASPGTNASMVFNYGFSMSSYTAANASTGIISANKFDLRCPSLASTVIDITTQISIPILGNYLYYWLDVRELKNPITLTVNAIPVALANQVYSAK